MDELKNYPELNTGNKAQDNINKYKTLQVKHMDEFIKLSNSEELWLDWINVVPDAATLDDYVDIALDDELYDLVCKVFNRLVLTDEWKY